MHTGEFRGQSSQLYSQAQQPTPVTVSWETRDVDGRFAKTAAVVVEGDPNRQEISFAIGGEVKPAISLTPRNGVLDLGTIAANQGGSGTIAIASHFSPGIKVLSATPAKPSDVGVEVAPMSQLARDAAGLLAQTGGYLMRVTVPSPPRELAHSAKNCESRRIIHLSGNCGLLCREKNRHDHSCPRDRPLVKC